MRRALVVVIAALLLAACGDEGARRPMVPAAREAVAPAPVVVGEWTIRRTEYGLRAERPGAGEPEVCLILPGKAVLIHRQPVDREVHLPDGKAALRRGGGTAGPLGLYREAPVDDRLDLLAAMRGRATWLEPPRR